MGISALVGVGGKFLLVLDSWDLISLKFLFFEYTFFINPPTASAVGRRASQEALAFSRTSFVKSYVYVDGFNLYFGSLKGTPYKWLNLLDFFQKRLPANTATHWRSIKNHQLGLSQFPPIIQDKVGTIRKPTAW